jgi:hypothetical protein
MGKKIAVYSQPGGNLRTIKSAGRTCRPLQQRDLRHQLYCQRNATTGSTRNARQAGIAADASMTNTVNALATA